MLGCVSDLCRGLLGCRGGRVHSRQIALILVDGGIPGHTERGVGIIQIGWLKGIWKEEIGVTGVQVRHRLPGLSEVAPAVSSLSYPESSMLTVRG